MHWDIVTATTPSLEAHRYALILADNLSPLTSCALSSTHFSRIDGRAQAHQRLHRLDPVIVCSKVQGRPFLRRARRVGSSAARSAAHARAE